MSTRAIVRVMKTTKSYNYQLDALTLGFSLNILNKEELSNFIILLDEAKKEIEKDISLLEVCENK